MWQIGDVILNRYEVKDIKEGGMGIVYIVRPYNWEGLEAIKTFKDKFLWNENVIQRFRKEAEIWVKLGVHPNIVYAPFVEIIEGRPFIIMEYIDGGNLTDYISHLDVDDAVIFAIEFCDGMNYAYNKMKVVHRDIKPGNVMVTKDKKIVKIADFGLAKIYDNLAIEELRKRGIAPSQTGGGLTPSYASPEQFLDTKNVDTRSDIYSFGVMFYELLTGRLPFYTDTQPEGLQATPEEKWKMIQELRSKHFYEVPKIPSIVAPSMQIPKEINAIVMKCLCKKPKERFQTFAELRKALGDYLGVVPVLEMKSDPEAIAKSIFFKGIGLDNLGKHEEAIECYDEVLTKGFVGLELSILANKGKALFNLNRFRKALECYDQALNIAFELGSEVPPQISAKIWSDKGTVLFKLNKPEESIKCYNQALTLNLKDTSAWNNKGNALAILGKHEEAIESFKKALEINPRYLEAWNNKGLSYIALKNNDEAFKCFKQALRISPRYANAWYSMGNIIEASKKFKEAIECYNKTLQINPKDLGAWNRKGFCLEKLNRYGEAIRCFEKVLEIKPEDEKVWMETGLCFFKLGNYNKAIESYDKVLKINPNRASAYFDLGNIYDKQGRLDLAILEYKRSIEIDPNFVSAHYNLGHTYVEQKKFDIAMIEFKKALEIDPNHALSHYGLGLTYAKHGMYQEAIDAFSKFIEIAPPEYAPEIMGAKKAIRKIKETIKKEGGYYDRG